ncbi:NAD(+) synthase [Salinigranum halophilum]|uniref:NAD(+) synthase n=1 Tax=Salinigranum halophilum TaxID=2565931 RepID=UPI00115DDE07|nr:NAD(+) synthase [Salinigranum halophilum]
MTLTVSLAQLGPTTADIGHNTGLLADAYDRAVRAGADVVVFPEMAVTGYCILDLVEDDTFVDRNREALSELATRTGETAAVVGFVDRDGEARYNAAAVCQHGEVAGTARKVLLPNYRYFDDERYFEPGEEVAPIAVDVGDTTVSLGVSVCEDLWDDAYDRRPVRELVDGGADVVVNLNASPFEVGKRADRARVVRDHVDATGVPVLYVNTAGVADVGRNVIVFDGDSLAVDATGALVARGAQFDTDLLTVTLDDDGVGQHVSGGVAAADGPLVPAGETVKPERRERELFEALAFGLRGYARRTGFETVIESVSGGIDSSLGLAICVEALGPDNVVAYNLPSSVNTETTKGIAADLAANLGVDYRVVPVQSSFEELLDTYESHAGPVSRGVAKENLYARVRGLLMMLASNDSGGLLVTNGNETEMALGYVTLYGDACGGLSILGDLSKRDVYDVARYVNERAGEAVIPEAVFDIPPSAELSADQVDPFDYDVVAPVVSDLLEGRLSPAEVVARFERRALDPERYRPDDEGRTVYDKFDAEGFSTVVYDTYRRMKQNTFKRVQTPPVVAVSGRAFGTDFREPIINGWDGR